MKKICILFLFFGALLACNQKKENTTTQNAEKTNAVPFRQDSLKNDIEKNKELILVHEIDPDCETYFLSLLNSSKNFKADVLGLDQEIKKNNGIGLVIKLKKEENQIRFFVLESYPEKDTAVGTYFFNTKTKKLYREDYIAENPVEINFNKNLLTHNSNCNF